MKRSSIVFLQVVVVLIGFGTLAVMLWFPHIEGRNANATSFEVYFKDPFLAYVYLGSVAFYVALYQAFKVLGYAGQNRIFSKEVVKGLRAIKYCSMTLLGFVVGALIFIMLAESDDRAGGVVMGVFVTLGAIVMATLATMFERILQNAVDLKSENDLTV